MLIQVTILKGLRNLSCVLPNAWLRKNYLKNGVFLPRFRSGAEDRGRLNQIADLARGPRFAPRALMVLSEIALKDDKGRRCS